MTRTSRTATTCLATLALGVMGAGAALAQETMSHAQCDQVLMVGPQHYSPAVLAACTPYFTALADGAVATGTFTTIRPDSVVTLSTAGTGG